MTYYPECPNCGARVEIDRMTNTTHAGTCPACKYLVVFVFNIPDWPTSVTYKDPSHPENEWVTKSLAPKVTFSDLERSANLILEEFNKFKQMYKEAYPYAPELEGEQDNG